jgi:hypothetical protein
MRDGFIRVAGNSKAALCALALTLLLLPSGPAHAEDCAPDAVKQAREALAKDAPAGDRIALQCLLQSIEDLQEKLNAVLKGEIAFTGPIIAPEFLYSKKGDAQ